MVASIPHEMHNLTASSASSESMTYPSSSDADIVSTDSAKTIQREAHAADSISTLITSNTLDDTHNSALNPSCVNMETKKKLQPKIRTGKTAVITSEEYKNELIAQKIKNIKKEPKQSRNTLPKPKTTRKPLSEISNLSSASAPIASNKRKKSAPSKPSKKRSVDPASSEVLQEILVPPLQGQNELILQINGMNYSVEPQVINPENMYVLPYDEELMNNLTAMDNTCD